MYLCYIEKIINSNLVNTLLTAFVAVFGFYYVQKKTKVNDADRLFREEKRRIYMDFSVNCNVRKIFEIYIQTMAGLTEKKVVTTEIRKKSARTEVAFHLGSILNQLSLISDEDNLSLFKENIASYQDLLLKYCDMAISSYVKNEEGQISGTIDNERISGLLRECNKAFENIIAIMRLDLYKV